MPRLANCWDPETVHIFMRWHCGALAGTAQGDFACCGMSRVLWRSNHVGHLACSDTGVAAAERSASGVAAGPHPAAGRCCASCCVTSVSTEWHLLCHVSYADWAAENQLLATR